MKPSIGALIFLMVLVSTSDWLVAGENQPQQLDTAQIAQIVEKALPGARIREMELEVEGGRLVYEVEVVTADGHKKEMHIDAISGRIEKIEND